MWATVALALALAVLAGLIVMRLDRDGEARPEAGPAAPAERRPAAERPLTRTAAETTSRREPEARIGEVEAILGAADPRTLEGRVAELPSVVVQEVISDRAFTVGKEGGQGLLVMLDDRIVAKLAEDKARVQRGMKLRIAGRVWPAPTPDVAQERYKGLNVRESAAMRAQKAYLHAEALGRAQ